MPWCLKHQAISIHNADKKFVLLEQFHTEILHLYEIILENKINFDKNT